MTTSDSGSSDAETYDFFTVEVDPGQQEAAVCSCAAASYAQRWLTSNLLREYPATMTAHNADRMAAFVSGYHTAISLIRIALHDEPDDEGRLQVLDHGKPHTW